MPSTRSQITIQFPKRKSAMPREKDGRHAAQAKPDLPLSPRDLPLSPRDLPLSPRDLPLSPRDLPLSPRDLPLSPRKRLGDDNLCNLPKPLQCSPPKQSRKENGPPSPPKGRRLLFDDNPGGAAALVSPVKKQQGSPAPSPLRRGQETPSGGEARRPQERRGACARLFKQEGSCYQQAKQALNTAVPARLLEREAETDAIRLFLRDHVRGRKPGSLYISGAPGTGKTACLSKLLQDCKEELAGCRTVHINCMTLRSSHAVFPAIAEAVAERGGALPPAPAAAAAGKDVARRLEKLVTSAGPVILLVLDEMDQLDSKGQDVLYTVFEWPWLGNSRLVLIGIANALDLTDRILPRLQARPRCKPQLLNFSPYTRDQIAAILQDRLTQVPGEQVLDNAAIQFCARKVSAVSGDARKALDVCRRAVEMVESDARGQAVLRPLPECTSPRKAAPKKVSLPHVSRVISDVYGDKMTSGGRADESFPLQQKLVVCALLLLTGQSKVKEVTLGKLHEAYSKVCRKQQMPAVGQSECLCLCSLLETRGILGLKKAKDARLAKVSLKIEARDVEHAFKDKVLIGNVLHAGL